MKSDGVESANEGKINQLLKVMPNFRLQRFDPDGHKSRERNANITQPNA
jgi:hypothetical protein